MFGPLAAWILGHRRLVAGLLVLTLLLTAAGLAQLRIDFSFKSFVGSTDPAFERLEDFAEQWGSEDGVLLVLAQLPDDGSADFTSKTRLLQLDRVLQALDGTAAVKRSLGLPRIPRDAGSIGMLSFKPVLDLAPEADDDEAFRKTLLADTTLVPGLLSADGRATMMLVELAINSDDIIAFRPAIEEIRTVLRAHEKDGLVLLCAGIPAVRADLVQTIQTDQVIFGSLTALIMALLLLVLFRRLHGLLICGAAAALPTAMLHGVMGWEGEPIGVLNQVYVTLIPVIAVADAIHVMARFHTEARSRLSDGAVLDAAVRREAIVATYAEVGTACLFTSVTTAIGFLSLVLADMTALRDFGTHASLGILFAFFLLLFGGPLLLDRIRSLPPMRQGRGSLEGLLEGLAHQVLARAWPILGVTAVLVAGMVWVGKDVIVDNRLSDTLGEGHATHAAGLIVDEKLGGQFSIHIDLAGAKGALFEPVALQAADQLERDARALPGVRAVEGPGLIFRSLNKALTQQDEVPGTRALAEQLLFLADAAAQDSPVLKPAGARGRIIVHVPDAGGNRMVELGDALDARASELFAATGVQATVTGIPYVASRGFNRLSRELLESLLAALALIALVLGALFRSLRIMVICLVPNLAPLLACVALLAALGWTLAPTVAVVFTVALGIAVDDTIHLLARLYEARRKTHDPDQMLTAAIVHTGRPVMLTTLILTTGFAINTLSSFPVLRHFGTLGSAAFITALVADLVVLPAMLKVFGGLKRPG